MFVQNSNLSLTDYNNRNIVEKYTVEYYKNKNKKYRQYLFDINR